MATDFGFIPANSGQFYFISYNTEDSSRIAPIVRYMNSCGVPLWYDYGLEYGKEWETQIASHIADCEAVLMFVTKGLFYKEKSYVRKEYDEAVIYGKKIIPVFLDDIKPSALPRHSVGFYVDLNRLHNVKCAKSDSVQTIAQNAARALGVKLREPVTITENKPNPEPKTMPMQKPAEAPKAAEPRQVKATPESDKSSKSRKPLIFAIICAVVALAVIGAVIGSVMSGDFDSGSHGASGNSTQTTSSVPDGLKYKIVDGRAIIIGYLGNASTLTIPSEIDGAKVTGIGYEAFDGCTGLTEITIPDSVTSVGDWAFGGCTGLTEITIPDSVTSIGDWAFSDCTSLTEITIPDSVTSIGMKAFDGCTGLTEITIPDSVTSIGDLVFYDCTSLTEITIPDSVTSIGNYAFYDCDSLTEIIIPDSITSIGIGAFIYCSSLTEINVSSSNKHYANKDGVLYNKSFSELICCPGGKSGSFTIPSSVTSIGVGAFYGCTSLTEITIPDSVTSIGAQAFDGCTSLTEINIPDSVTTIGESAFINCSSLTEINVSSSNKHYANKDGVLYNKSFSELICCPGGKSGSFTIPSRVASIGAGAFDGCTDLTEINIPNSVTSIGGCAFDGCTGLTEITIPDSVTTIGNWAFDGCTITVRAPHEASYYDYEPDEGVTWVVE